MVKKTDFIFSEKELIQMILSTIKRYPNESTSFDITVTGHQKDAVILTMMEHNLGKEYGLI